MKRRALFLWVLALFMISAVPANARAALTSRDAVAENNSIETREYKLRDRRVAGNESLRQNITAWRVTNGTWNGEALGGLSLVLVETASDNGTTTPTTNCYISHIATMAQREALVSAFVTAQGLSPEYVTSWRMEPSIIRLEINGQTVIIHLGLIS